MSIITIEQSLKLFKSGEICSLKFVRFDKNRKTGGQFDILQDVVLTQSLVKPEHEYAKEKTRDKNSKDPAHFQHSTLNFVQCINGTATAARPSKVHLFLIVEVNGKKVMV